MRGVPHTLALSTSLTPAPFDGTTVPPGQRTGWSGDGAPGSGTLRDFPTGAVTQHFPKTLNRVPGVDFRLPTDDELDAMEAFQLFLGRDEDPDITAINFTSPVVALGRDIFNNGDINAPIAAGKCSACHANGGATAGGLFNANFNTGVEDSPDQPADLIDPANNPSDDGFGNPGNGTFNTPPVIEAADTGPFFHNNSIETIEGTVAFYNGDAFNNSPGGQGLAFTTGSPGINLEPTQVVAVAAFLRVMNARENIRSAVETAVFTRDEVSYSAVARDLLKLAIEETNDGREVLRGGGLHPKAQKFLRRARNPLKVAARLHRPFIRNFFINRALKNLKQADSDMVAE